MALMKIVEGISRSLNNLLERFHQSFFFYVIVSSERFISIGDYMPCIGLMAGSLLIKSFLLWLISNNKSNDDSTETEESEKILIVKKSVRNIDVLRVGSVFFVAHLIGVMAMFVTTNKRIHDYFHSINIPTQSGIFYLVLGILAISLLAPRFLRLNHSDGQFLNVILLLELGTMLLSVSMLNFSLGFFLCVIIVPFAILFNVCGSAKRNLFKFIIKSFMHAMVHPLTLIYGVILTMSFASFSEMNFNYILDKSFKATIDGITYSVVDSLVSSIFRISVVQNLFIFIFLDLRKLVL
jgi:GPI-anchor transamidase subunit GAA1